MNKPTKQEIIKTLNLQKEIFGDELFIPKNKMKVSVVKEPETLFGETKLFNAEKEDWEKSTSLDQLEKLICNCTKCRLHKGRNKFVFGSGNPNADVLVIGEGPGAEEDKQGLPFVGRAGQLLTDMLKAIKFSREEVYIGNIVKCRPPENRTPMQDEMDTCLPYLKKQVELIKPKLILCLGLTAAKGLLNKRESLGELRKSIFDYEGAKVIVTYHPAALLRNPHWKKDCWEDLKKFRKMYDAP
ncbi:MAG: uracil-DNA glycosylase [Ignavibacteriota bacterium]|nr:MAG: uracil-DNA glycosylase [Chlorobiota bacterium]MBE7476475.1 uracil-DNA glycosylase [Ignavibacteriales bacterium]MBL1123610.1 uracil-DNA glycosylase [Ignavibacteriota bacterium]MCE7855533.1 uracil-DNA glycosylase [Ignavibacteria bacterium CHB3]MCZ7614370.1 uracil-DNA glycosylase [Ignavibacteriaceae bacterium]MEB2297046.1 uracil-DNA glycosylase [Ignavibacteria bacterium]